ncbi:MAG: FAD-binding oxidoreductase [Candidatus Njordarchaeia archaeon]
MIKQLKKIVGEENVETDPAVIKLYGKEASGLESLAMAVVFPQNTKQVSDLVKFAYRNNIKLYPQGSASTLTGSALPEEDGLIISFSKMNKILEYSIVDGYVVCQPGVRLVDLNEFLSKDGYMFPIDPGSYPVLTVGGAVASNAGGLKAAKYGTTKDWVMALEVVLPDEKGTVIRVGCKTAKCRQGYDLVRLFVGSEGTLGIITEATLKIAPIPENIVYVAAFFDKLKDIVKAIENVRRSRLTISVMELIDKNSVENGLRLIKVDWAVKKNFFIVGVEGPKEASKRYIDILEKALTEAGGTNIVKAKSEEEADALKIFDFRLACFSYTAQLDMRGGGAGERIKPVEYNEDIGALPSKIPTIFKKLRELEKEYNVSLIATMHVLDGVVHPSIWFNALNPEEKKRAEKFFEEIIRIAIKEGGTASAEHGIGLLKKDGLIREFKELRSGRALELMRELKEIFDPKGILNPNKIFEINMSSPQK